MDPQQREHFRANGWIVVKDVLSQGTVAAANELYDGHLDGSLTAHPDDVGWDGGLTTRESDMWYNAGQARPAEERHNRQRVLWGEPFYEMVNPPKVRPPVFAPAPHPCLTSVGGGLCRRSRRSWRRCSVWRSGGTSCRAPHQRWLIATA